MTSACKLVELIPGLVLTRCRVFDPPEDNPVQKFSRSVVPQGKRVKDQTFGFDRIFDENVTQGEVYEATTRSLLDSVLDGYNATVFAYGATGCGKTHTITGTAQAPGIIFMTMQELFERIGETTDEKVTEITLSYLEIYNETIRDLLMPKETRGGLMLREDANQAVSVSGLSSHHPQNVEQVMEMIMRGNECRTMSPTEANATSSRSHAVLQINVAQKDRNADINEPHTMATLSIIDLAGSERASATKNRGERLIEGANINRSLLALGSCINALCDPRKRNHVPYRNSKLTRLLKFSLGGNCKTVMIVCVSPSSQHFDETQNTLRYANRAKNIQTKVTRNVYNVNRHVKDFLVKIDEQMALINELKAQQKDQENLAFAKFRKQNEKKESIAKEGISRIRAAYENSAAERQERAKNMINLRGVQKRISVLGSWIAAFDSVCDNIDSDEPMTNLQAVRRSAHGILTDLEASRHHCHQKVVKSNWDRALNSALENGLRQLKELDTGDSLDAATLSREVELLKAQAERESLLAVAEHDKVGEAATIQVLLQAHFEVISSIEALNRMSVDDAVETATTILNQMLIACTKAASHVVTPDGSIAPVEAFAPTKAGTPKRRKTTNLIPGVPSIKPPMSAAFATAPHLTLTPTKSSPKRKVLAGSAKKGVIITPRKKKSPVKGLKRGVRWRDDTEDGTLAEFSQTPQQTQYTPDAEQSSAELPLPDMSSLAMVPPITSEQPSSSPIPEPPQVSTAMQENRPNRFKAGFLSKKSDGSPLSSTLPQPPTMSIRLSSSSTSDTENSPLRELQPSYTQNRRSLSYSNPSEIDNSGSDTENLFRGSSNDKSLQPSKAEALKIRHALKRASLSGSSSRASDAHVYKQSRTQRRRSPTAATSTSPPRSDGEVQGLFSAGHARRMVGKDNHGPDWRAGVLSPRVMGVAGVSGRMGGAGRRATLLAGMGSGMGEARGREREGADLHRLSSVHNNSIAAARDRGSMAFAGKGVWR